MGSLTIKSAPLETCCSEGPSNKPKTIGKLTIYPSTQVENEIVPTAPFIDRLSVISTIESTALGESLKDTHTLATLDSSCFKQCKPSKGFSRAYRLALPSVINSERWPHYQFRCESDCVTKIRIEFVPIDLGWEGMVDLHAALTPLLPNGWKHFVSNGLVSRLDVAVDIPGVTMNDFHILPSQCLTVTRRSNKGMLQTVELGKPIGNQTCIYDRYSKRVAKGQGHKFQQSVRVERRLKGTKLPLSDLPEMKNAFEGLNLVAEAYGKPQDELNWRWLHFVCCVKQIGLESALASVPTKRRAKYRKHLQGQCTNWWNVNSIWEGWQSSLQLLPIANPKAFV